MLFNSYVFILAFLPLFLLVWWRGFKDVRFRFGALVAFSYIFYGYWDWRFTLLMLFSTIVDYIAGLKLDASPTDRGRKLWLTVSMVTNLSVLAGFKYFNFGVENLAHLLGWVGHDVSWSAFDIILPVGISFYTFQSMSYTIDIYKGDARPTKDFISFAAYVSMFPQLVAGPIVRYSELDEQLRDVPEKLTAPYALLGLQFFIVGLAKKLFIADRLAVGPTGADSLFALGTNMDFFAGWLAALTYTGQIYFDFSAYSDMAVGLGLLLGFKLPQNFDSPYKSKSISEFWRRWHMTFSFWLRDYLYISLGGSRGGKLKTMRNLVITMFLGGLWHGASWTFVAWGLYHGLLLVVNHMWRDAKIWKMPALLGTAITFLSVVVGWVFFRAETFAKATSIFVGMAGLNGFDLSFAWVAKLKFVFAFAALGVAFFMPNSWQLPVASKRWQVILLGVLFAACILSLDKKSPFLYFQF